METTAAGRVLTEAKVENIYDLFEMGQGKRTDDQVRRIVVADALVDAGATTLGLPTRMMALRQPCGRRRG